MNPPKKLLTADNPALHQRAKAMQAAYDHARTAYLNSLGFTVLRFWNYEILQQTNDVLAEILRVLQELEKQPAR